ncbi:hypothetical protein B0H10DRAFT_2214142 [Mycena sp. CBHHK59/15]|nr:hypothetical protein B0H10DRAFT_2214142 [Mycena sp. CBHHK59/15]
MDIIRNNDEEEQDLATEWDPSDWILCGKEYKDVPQIVEVARRSVLRLPTSIQHHLPSKTMTISQLLNFDVPPLADDDTAMDNDTKNYSASEPTANIEEILAFLALPNRSLLRKIIDGFGQAWFDGKKSLRTWLHPEVRYPFWALTYWGEMIDVCKAKDVWLRADVWLKKRGKTEEERTMKHTVYGLWNVAGWHGSLHGFGSLETLDLAKFFSEDYLEGSIVNAMLALLSLRLTGSGDDQLIVNTTFARFICMVLPAVDGKAASPITSSPGAQRYLEKYGEWFQSPEHSHLHLVLYRPIKHWTACSIDFRDHRIQYGDSLGWKRPEDFFAGLKLWIDKYHGNTEFTITDDLPCAVQTDGHNCPIISVNTVAHRALGDPLWTPETAKAMRMKAFCDILKYALSIKRSATPNTPLVDPNDLGENILAVDVDVNEAVMAGSSSRIEARAGDDKLTSGSPLVPASFTQVNHPVKRVAEEMDDVEQPAKKLTKTTDISGRATHPFLIPNTRNNSGSSNSRLTAKSSASKTKKDRNSNAGDQNRSSLVVGDNTWSLERRYFQHVVNGDFKDDTVFNGIVEAKVLGKTREIKGLGNQNFKHSEDVDAVFGLIHTISPRAYRELRKHLNLRTERSIKHVISKSPRFPVGIQDTTFNYAQKYCEDYKYPLGAPLSIAVDDTKLFSALRPLYDSVKQKWFIVGTTGDPIEVPDVETLHKRLDELESSSEMATKLRLWTLQIPLPGVPPVVLAIMPIGSKVKGPQLSEWQLLLMNGLISRGFRITSSGGDGVSVERDCQCRTGAASKLMEYCIKHPDPGYPDIVVVIWELNGNIWVEWNDAKHGRKTFRNNAFSGACALILGNFVVFFAQVFTLAMKPNSPMYPRDLKAHSRMDDPAAARLFSADTLEQASEDPINNLGLVVYLLVFGDLIDAYQSRTLSHHERAKIVICTHLFLQTWRMYLKKAGYSEARHFISKEAFSIAEILINGLLALIIIHRDHLGDHPCPLLPWLHASEPNEHCFSGFRDISEDFTMQEAILIVPKLHAKMQAAVRVRLNQSDFKKQVSGYCHMYFTSEDIDFALLGQYPTDVELSTAYQIAVEENNCLWSLLGIHPDQIQSAPTPGLVPQPSPDPDFESLYLDEDSVESSPSEITEQTAAEELQSMIDGLKNVANISRCGDDELDACVMASVALSMDELAKIEDLPESDPECFAEIQKDIAHAMATQPAAFIALLQGIAESRPKMHSDANTVVPEVLPPSSKPLVDVSADDLAPFVALRREHQTREAKMGVRTYKSSATYKTSKTGIEKPLSDRQRLAQQMQAIVRRDQERGSSAGLNRTVRWKTDTKSSTVMPTITAKTGNAANTEVAAGGRAKDTLKRR